jgi:predicted enzyme related to lactoylglutathione lyase
MMSADMPDYPDAVLAVANVDSRNPERLAAFWGALLGREVGTIDGVYYGLEWAPRFGAGMSFQRVADPTPGKNRIHMDVICSDIEATAKRAEELGAARADGYPQTPLGIVMTDPDGNVFCLIPPPGA